jgi:peptide/nickel transport system substrate-binding protein
MMVRRISKIGLVFLTVAFIAYSAGAAEVTIGVRAEPSMDPHFLYLGTNVAFSKHLFGRLVDRDANSRKFPDLAVSWKPLDDTTWEFKLRQGVRFHDGSAFTAEDVVFSIERIPNVPNNPASYHSNTRSIVGMEIVDPHTLIVKTDKPNPVLPAQIHNVAIVSKKVAEGASTADFTSGKAAIGTGPFKFVQFIPGDRWVLERNEDYWGEKPVWDRVTFRMISNDAARVAALLGGDVDMIDFVPPTEVPHLEKNKNITVFKRPSDRVIFLVCDNIRDSSPFVTGKDGKPLDKNPLKDVRVRRAISKAINREAICSRVMEGLAAPASQLIPEGWFSYNPEIEVERYEPESARKLLAEAGYPDGFGLTIHGPNDRYVNDAKVCQAVAQMLARIGLDMKVETMPKTVYFPRMAPPENEFSFFLLGWGNSTTGEATHGLMAVFHSYAKGKGAGSYNGGYSNPEFDRVAEEAVRIVDEVKREKALQQAMAVLLNDQGMVPLHTQFTIAATRKGLVYVPRADEGTLAYNLKPAP